MDNNLDQAVLEYSDEPSSAQRRAGTHVQHPWRLLNSQAEGESKPQDLSEEVEQGRF